MKQGIIDEYLNSKKDNYPNWPDFLFGYKRTKKKSLTKEEAHEFGVNLYIHSKRGILNNMSKGDGYRLNFLLNDLNDNNPRDELMKETAPTFVFDFENITPENVKEKMQNRSLPRFEGETSDEYIERLKKKELITP